MCALIFVVPFVQMARDDSRDQSAFVQVEARVTNIEASVVVEEDREELPDVLIETSLPVQLSDDVLDWRGFFAGGQCHEVLLTVEPFEVFTEYSLYIGISEYGRFVSSGTFEHVLLSFDGCDNFEWYLFEGTEYEMACRNLDFNYHRPRNLLLMFTGDDDFLVFIELYYH